jgi:histidyl-tRNA synthetase
MFLGKDLPATGVSIGIERIIDAGLELGIYKLNVKTLTQIQVIVLDKNSYKYAWDVTYRLRDSGFNVRIDLGRLREQAQRKRARKLSIPVLIFIGEKERASRTVTVYFTRLQERFENVKIEEAEKIIRSKL